MRHALALLAAILSLTLAAGPARADNIYRPSLERMCLYADAIVAGTIDGPRHITVTEVFLAGPGNVGVGEQLEVTELAGLSMQHLRSPTAPALRPAEVVVFLDTSVNGGWRAIGRSDQEGAGAAGVYWVDSAGAVSGYEQVMNPGPLTLVTGGSLESGDVPATRLALAGRVREGLAQRALWLQTTTLPPAERARRVLAYTLPRTAPRGYHDGMLEHRELRRSLVALRAALVPAAVAFLNLARRDEDVGTVVVALADIGPPARAAVPALRRLRARGTRTPAVWIDHALTALEGAPPR